MKLLEGRDVAEFIQERHFAIVRGLGQTPRLAIVRMGDDAATDRYLRGKARYGAEIGAEVTMHAETGDSILERIAALNADPAVTGIIIQLPLTDRALTAQALAAVAPAKDVDGLGPDSPYETATPKAVLWLLAAHNVDLKGRIAIVGQGRLVGRPLADRLEASGHEVIRCDINTPDLGDAIRTADMIFTGTGRPGLIKSAMVKDGAVVVDTGSPVGELEPALYDRTDLILTPNPGGVGPMTVAALFDNLLIAAQQAATTARRH